MRMHEGDDDLPMLPRLAVWYIDSNELPSPPEADPLQLRIRCSPGNAVGTQLVGSAAIAHFMHARVLESNVQQVDTFSDWVEIMSQAGKNRAI